MTTDSEAWWQAFLVAYRECIRLAGSLAANGATEAAAANGADHALDQFRERQKRGDFGALASWQACMPADEMAETLARTHRERDEARQGMDQQTQRAYVAEQERDEQRARVEATEARLSELESITIERDQLKRGLDAEMRASDDWKKRAFAAEYDRDAARRQASSYFDAANASNQRYDCAERAESLLKEATGALNALAMRLGEPWPRRLADEMLDAKDVLSKARAAGYVP